MNDAINLLYSIFNECIFLLFLYVSFLIHHIFIALFKTLHFNSSVTITHIILTLKLPFLKEDSLVQVSYFSSSFLFGFILIGH